MLAILFIIYHSGHAVQERICAGGAKQKETADARLSWDGVGKLAVGRGGLLLQHGLDDVDFLTVLFDDLALVVPLIIDSSAINLNVLGGFDIQLSSTVQLVLNSLLALAVVVGVQIGMAGNSVGVLALVQLFDGVLSDAGACLSGIEHTGGEEIVDAAAGDMEAPATATADRPATFRKERRDRIMVVSS